MSTKRDYYEILGVEKDTDVNTVKRAYRKLAMKYHPDRNKDDDAAAEKFREATEAYEVLSDTDKRTRYDQYGHAGVDEQMQDFWARGGFQESQAFHDFGDVFGDVFGDIFGFSGGRDRIGRGADLRYQLEMTLEDTANGREVELDIPRHITCTLCHGSGARPGTHPVPCRTCGGHGQIQMQQGFFAVRRTCPECQGQGTRIDSPCVECSGAGRIRKTKKLKVRIPPGVYDGAQVRVGGEGEAGMQGAPTGDLYIVIRLRKHTIFEREGADLYCDMPITFPQASLGSEVDAPTLNGRIKIKIPAGTESAKVFRLRGKGVPDIRVNKTGDLYVRIRVVVPMTLSKKQEHLLREFAAEAGDDVYPERTSFLDKAKRFWDDLAGEVKS